MNENVKTVVTIILSGLLIFAIAVIVFMIATYPQQTTYQEMIFEPDPNYNGTLDYNVGTPMHDRLEGCIQNITLYFEIIEYYFDHKMFDKLDQVFNASWENMSFLYNESWFYIHWYIDYYGGGDSHIINMYYYRYYELEDELLRYEKLHKIFLGGLSNMVIK